MIQLKMLKSVAKSGVSWTDYAINFWYGCTKYSPGCIHCYAQTLTERFSKSNFGGATWGKDGKRSPYDKADQKAAFINNKALKNNTRYRVFSNDMSDFFEAHEALSEYRKEAWNIIRDNTRIDWLLLTKRSEHIQSMLPDDFYSGSYSHVNLGVTCEGVGQLYRLDDLRGIKDWGGLRWVSYEPALNPIHEKANLDKIAWIIYGGESCADQSQIRHADDAWAVALRQRCLEEGVAFFYKQNSARPGHHLTDLNGETIQEYPRFNHP